MLSKAAGDTQLGVEHAGDTLKHYPGMALGGQPKGHPRARKIGRLTTSRRLINASTKSCTQHRITWLST